MKGASEKEVLPLEFHLTPKRFPPETFVYGFIYIYIYMYGDIRYTNSEGVELDAD